MRPAVTNRTAGCWPFGVSRKLAKCATCGGIWADLRANDLLVAEGWSDAYYGNFTYASDGDRPTRVRLVVVPVRWKDRVTVGIAHAHQPTPGRILPLGFGR